MFFFSGLGSIVCTNQTKLKKGIFRSNLCQGCSSERVSTVSLQHMNDYYSDVSFLFNVCIFCIYSCIGISYSCSHRTTVLTELIKHSIANEMT